MDVSDIDRQNVLSMIQEKLLEWSRYNADPNLLQKLYELALSLEELVYKKATSKDDYLAMIQSKLYAITSNAFPGDVTALTAEIQLMSKMFQRKVVRSKTTKASEWKLLIDQHHLARTAYLTELVSMQKRAKEECAKAQGVYQPEKVQLIKFCEQMIKFLFLCESDLTCVSKETVRLYLSEIINFFSSKMNRGLQVSNEQISVNHLQKTPSVSHTAFASNPMISSLTMENVFPHSQSNASISPLYCSPGATKRIDMQTVLNKGSQSIAEQDANFNLKQNSEPMQPSDMDQPLKKQQIRKPRKLPKEKDFMDSMFLPSTNITSRNAQRRPSRGRLPSTKIPPLKKRNALRASDTQHKPSIIAVDAASTPVTLSSALKEIRKPAQSVSPMELGAKKDDRETEVQDKSDPLGTSGTLTSSLMSDASAEINQLPRSAMLPIEPLIQAVQSASEKGTLKNAMNDIGSAINDMEKLPKYAGNDKSYLSMNYHYTTGDEHMPRRGMKHDIDSISRDTSTTLDNHRPRIVQPNHDLVLAEVREINQRLTETWVEVTSCSGSDSDSDSSKGTTVKCTYKMILSDNVKKQLAIMLPREALSIEFLVPSNYPEFPPKILDSGLLDGSGLENSALWEIAKSEFNSRVQGLELSLGEMAKAWDRCARQAFADVTRNFGVETFSSKYGACKDINVVNLL